MTVALGAPAGPLAVSDPRPIEELRAVLASAGFEGEAVRSALGVDSHVLARPADLPVQRRRLAGIEPLGTITTLFVLDTPVASADASRAFAPLRVEDLEALGLVESGGGLVRARVRLVPHDDVLIASDVPKIGAAQPPNHVAGIHGPSVTLAHLTVRRPVDRALDVGTGCGIQAILASRHCAQVTATDVNRRALNFAAFNALLNGAGNVELREGSFFEPVGGDRFELLVCNPPYVISPETAFLFRDSGLAGDAVSREVVSRAPEALAEGAFASMLLSWAQAPDEDWSSPLRDWVEASGCDALLLHYGTQDPLTHAASWTRDRHGGDPAAFDAALERWLGYLRRLGIEGVAYGGVVLRRREGANWVRAHRLPASGLGPAGDQIVRIFAAQDAISGFADEHALLGARLRLAQDARVEQQLELREGRWVADAGIRLDGGLGLGASLDPATARLLAGIDGRRTLAEVAAELAEREREDVDRVASAAVQVARGMLELGFLEVSPHR
jgi:Methyltransferase small domain